MAKEVPASVPRLAARTLLFWPTALVLWAIRATLRACETPVGRATLRPVFRVIATWILYARALPISQTRTSQALTPGTVHDLLAEQKHLAVIPCACRATARPCDHPLHGPHDSETCLSFGVAAILERLSGVARKVTAAEAQQICQRAVASGLVHHAILSLGRLTEVCNCCPQSCSALAAHRAGIRNAVRPSGLRAVRTNGCDGCKERPQRLCVAICPYGTEPGTDECMGCGLCAFHCPNQAIRMVEAAVPQGRR